MAMNSSQIMDVIRDMERRFAVDQWTVDGIALWPFLRVRLNFDLFRAHQLDQPAVTLAGYALAIAKNAARFCYASLADVRGNRLRPGRADVVFLSDGLSFALLNGSWYEKYCDPLIERFSERGLSSLLVSPSHAYHIPRHTPSIFIQPRLDAVMVRRTLHAPRMAVSEAFGREYPQYARRLRELDLDVAALTTDAVFRYAAIIRDIAELYRGILSRAVARLAFIVCYYSVEGMAFNLACRELGIPSVELQHGGGFEGDLHVAYAAWTKVPQDGYALLPSHFWCWTGNDVEVIRRWNATVAGRHQPVLGGNPWMNEWRAGTSAVVSEYDHRVAAAQGAAADRRQLLVTLQYGFADDRALGPLLDAIRRTQHEWRWWVRLHPVMLTERDAVRSLLAHHGIVEYDLDAASDLPLYALLRHMDLHLTHSSATVIETSAFGIPSVIVSEYGREFFPAQITAGRARAANSTDEIIAACRSLLDDGGRMKQDASPPVEAGPAIDLLLSQIAPRSKEPTAS